MMRHAVIFSVGIVCYLVAIRLLPHPPLVPGSMANRFHAVLTTRDVSAPGTPSVFSFVETNAFKQLTHLSFTTRAGTDSSVKRYLAARLAHVQAQLRAMSERAATSEKTLADVRAAAADAASAASAAAAAATSRDAEARAELMAETARLQRAAQALESELRARIDAAAAAIRSLEVRAWSSAALCATIDVHQEQSMRCIT